MGVLRMVPKIKPLQFVPVQRPNGHQTSEWQAKVIEIIFDGMTVRVPVDADPDTLTQVLRAVRES